MGSGPRIAIDAMGGDTGPAVMVAGAARARQRRADLSFLMFGDRSAIEDFRTRVLARLVLLPPHDPQFRRNRERVVRDAEREHIVLEWDLGLPEDEAASN